jgi:hypothetical protein
MTSQKYLPVRIISLAGRPNECVISERRSNGRDQIYTLLSRVEYLLARHGLLERLCARPDLAVHNVVIFGSDFGNCAPDAVAF